MASQKKHHVVNLYASLVMKFDNRTRVNINNHDMQPAPKFFWVENLFVVSMVPPSKEQVIYGICINFWNLLNFLWLHMSFGYLECCRYNTVSNRQTADWFIGLIPSAVDAVFLWNVFCYNSQQVNVFYFCNRLSAHVAKSNEKAKRPRVVPSLKRNLKIIAEYEADIQSVNIRHKRGIPPIWPRTIVTDTQKIWWCYKNSSAWHN